MYKLFKSRVNHYRLLILSLLRRIKIHYRLDKTKFTHFTKSVRCPHRWYGNSYGGFYLAPAYIDTDSIVYSFGVGKDISFDMTLISRHGCTVHAFDPTPVTKKWQELQSLRQEFLFYDFGISGTNSGWIDFYLPKNPKGISGSIILHEDTNFQNKVQVYLKTFDDISSELGHSHVDLVKMDIEGAEYEVLESILASKVSVDQILVEFHDRYFDSDEGRSKSVVFKMEESGYHIFAHSLSYEEISFIHERKLENSQINAPSSPTAHPSHSKSPMVRARNK